MAKGVLRNHSPTFRSLEEEINQIPEEKLLAPVMPMGRGPQSAQFFSLRHTAALTGDREAGRFREQGGLSVFCMSLFCTGLQVVGAVLSVLVIIFNNVHVFAINSSLHSSVLKTLAQCVTVAKALGDSPEMNTSAVLALEEHTVCLLEEIKMINNT